MSRFQPTASMDLLNQKQNPPDKKDHQEQNGLKRHPDGHLQYLDDGRCKKEGKKAGDNDHDMPDLFEHIQRFNDQNQREPKCDDQVGPHEAQRKNTSGLEEKIEPGPALRESA
ncbi:hypothetical protein KSC_110450 [Ktedonobacter sp. SOSP1-52]|nr:hypothetical protein KSC_110450 [Ktedonobacter sp. SOSP1-52]